MAANKLPIFTHVPNIANSSAITDANTTKDLTSGTSYLVFTADATVGSYLQKLRIRPKGTNVVTVMRVFLNNGLTTATVGNNMLYDELTLPATTNSETASIAGNEIAMSMALPPGWRVYVTLGTLVAGGYVVTAVGGDY
jgi:hypothetical protein